MTEAELATEVRNAFVYSDDGKLIWQNPPKQHAQLRLKVAGRKEPKGMQQYSSKVSATAGIGQFGCTIMGTGRNLYATT